MRKRIGIPRNEQFVIYKLRTGKIELRKYLFILKRSLDSKVDYINLLMWLSTTTSDDSDTEYMLYHINIKLKRIVTGCFAFVDSFF